MGTTQGQRTPDSVGEVAACPRDMCCMGTASGGSTSRPTAAPSASGRLKEPFVVWPPRRILVCHSCQAARGQIPSRTSRVAALVGRQLRQALQGGSRALELCPTHQLTEVEAPVYVSGFCSPPTFPFILRSPMCVTHVCHSLLINLADFRD